MKLSKQIYNQDEALSSQAQSIRVAYISGPISGHKDGNRKAFEHVHLVLLNQGYAVVNPHFIGVDVPSRPEWPDMSPFERWRAYMDVCVKVIPNCTRMVMLRGWWWSRGARVEHRLARGLRIPITYQNGLLGGGLAPWP